MRTLICLFFLFFSSQLFSQEKKAEVESKLKDEDIPTQLRSMLDPYLRDARKVKFYEETDGAKRSIEAKFLFEGRFYSVEFDDSLKLEDVEVVQKTSALAPATRDAIVASLGEYDKFKIEKIQKQFAPKNLPDELVIQQAIISDLGELVRYELVVATKADKAWKTWEMLFTFEGVFLSKKEVVKRSADYILY